MQQQRGRTVLALSILALGFIAGSVLAATGEVAAVPVQPGVGQITSLVGEDPATVLAEVGGRKILAHEVNARALTMAAGEDSNKLYYIRSGALDLILEEILVAQEANKRKVSVDELMAQEVDAKMPKATDEIAKAWYDENPEIVTGREFELVKGQIKQHLDELEKALARRNYLLSLRDPAGVKVRLEIPRKVVRVTDSDPVSGPANAPITIVEFSDFECQYCAKIVPVLAKIKKLYGDKVRVVYRDLPLQFHQNAVPAALAAQCARDQGKFWEYHDKLFANTQALGVEQLREHAKALNLNIEEFSSCLDSQKHKALIDADMADAMALGVMGTPFVYVNGRPMQGGADYASLRDVIEEELRLSKK